MAMVTGPIGSEASAVKRALRKAIRDMKIREHDHGGLSHIEGMTLFDLKDTGDRFNIWARSLGALQIGAASLDSRISHHEISNEFTQLLQQLSKLLLELLPIINGERKQETWFKGSLVITADEFSDLELSTDEESLSDQGQDTETTGDADDTLITESSDLLLSINNSITNLMRLSIKIHRSSRSSKFARCPLDPNFNLEAEKNHVRQLFPFAAHDKILVYKLARANAQRRQWLIYRREHVERLGLDRITGDAETEMDTTQSDFGPEQQPTTQRRAQVAPSEPDTTASIFTSRTEDSKADRDTLSYSEHTEPRYGASVVVDSDPRLVVPEPPDYVKPGQPFACPYCQTVTEISGRKAWRKHVHEDLSSYICIFAGCDGVFYESRHQWAEHVSSVHLRQWRCEICSALSRSASDMYDHVRDRHADKIPSQNIQAQVDTYGRPSESTTASACPFCDYPSVLRRRGYSGEGDCTLSTKTFIQHVCRHLEQLALFVLPRDVLCEEERHETDDDDDEDEYVDRSSEMGEDVQNEESLTAKDEEAELEAIELILAELVTKEKPSDVFHEPPDLAMRWQPPHDFTPPADIFNTDDTDALPMRQEPTFGGDLFTPGWARGFDANKEGFCGRCTPGRWLNMPSGDYEFHMTYQHGCPTTGVPLPGPSSIRRVRGCQDRWEGYCDECMGWMVLRSTGRGWNWYRHWLLDHASVVRSMTEVTNRENPNRSKKSRAEDNLPEEAITDPHLLACIAKEDVDLLLKRLASGNLMNNIAATGSCAEAGRALLLRSAYQGSMGIIQILLEIGVSTNPGAGEASTALDLAVDSGFYSIAELLRESGEGFKQLAEARKILVNARFSSTPAPGEHPFSAGYSLDEGKIESKLGPLSTAVVQKDTRRLRQLFDETTGPNILDIEEGSDIGSTPFLIAASLKCYEIMNLLISQGANINATNRLGWTPLMLAVKCDDEETAHFLLNHGADVNHHSPDRWTALAEAASRGRNSIMRSLLASGADTESASQHDWVPLMHAAHRGDIEAVDILIDAGANVQTGSQHDETPLLLAAVSAQPTVVRRLLDSGCLPEPSWARAGSDSLEGGQAPVVRAHPLGWTPLMLACQSGSLEIVRILVQAGASTAPRSPMRRTALQIAQENGRIEITEYLESIKHSNKSK